MRPALQTRPFHEKSAPRMRVSKFSIHSLAGGEPFRMGFVGLIRRNRVGHWLLSEAVAPVNALQLEAAGRHAVLEVERHKAARTCSGSDCSLSVLSGGPRTPSMRVLLDALPRIEGAAG